MSVVYFVDELVDVDRVECFGHFESSQYCSMRGFFVEACEYAFVDLV